MRLAKTLVLLVLIGSASCASRKGPVTTDPAIFKPVAVRLHPVFTEIKDWTGDGQSDGVEAFVELTDQFDDPVKAGGQVLFELYTFRRQFPDARGNRIASWVMPLRTLKQQREHWRKIGGAYAFQLALTNMPDYSSAVLTAEFTLDDGGRLRDEIIVGARR